MSKQSSSVRTSGLSAMATVGNGDASDRYYAMERIAAGRPLAVEVVKVESANSFIGVLLVSGFGAAPGAEARVRQAAGTSHRDSVVRNIQGTEYVAPLRKGDVVTFDRAYADGGDLHAQSVSGRTHDWMKGRVQVSFGVGSASLTSVNKFGAVQLFTVLDPESAWTVRDEEDFRAAFKATAEAVDNGKPGFAFRSASGRWKLGSVDSESPLDAHVEHLIQDGLLSKGGSGEFIPMWSLRSSLAQVARDVDTRKECRRALGNVGRMFDAQGLRYQGFRPCVFISCDEDEMAFGARTGRLHRVAAGIQPIEGFHPVDIRSLPTRLRRGGGDAFGLSKLYLPDTLDRMKAEREARRPSEPRRLGSDARSKEIRRDVGEIRREARGWR